MVAFSSPVALAAVGLATSALAAPSGYKNVVYFMEWSIYGRNFHLADLDWWRITHVNYAFGKPAADGTVGVYDSWAATDKRYPDDSWSDTGNNVHGCFGQGHRLKQKYRNTKFGLSIGGWTLSDQFSAIASTAAGRATFAKSSVQLMLDLGLDFIDIDWEYPVEGGNDAPPVPHRPDDMANFVALLAAVRGELAKLPFQAELSVASPAGPANYRHWDFAAVCEQLDHINIMTYDMAGSWSNYTDHQANLYEDPDHPAGAKYSAHGAIQDYIKGGCPSHKIVMGIPAYGRSFEKTDGLYAPFSPPTAGSWVSGNDGKGIWDYKALPQSGAKEVFDAKLGAAYSYDPATRTFTSYDSPESLAVKLDYIKKYNLGGTMFWSGDADAKAGSPRSLITQVVATLGAENMAFGANNLHYPTSKYDNIRNGSAPLPSTPVPTSPTHAPTDVPTHAPTDGPTDTPTDGPTEAPTTKPTTKPTSKPTAKPTKQPTSKPTKQPTSKPTKQPTSKPTTEPTSDPTTAPSGDCGSHTKTCYWPLTQQTLPYGQEDCTKFSSFVWCP
ncbi:glycoside hydrolase family 18 protein [Achlya hypogyna]|uniref:Glycoside hydrolase family 18 protein n=1 Tax=Achlya hypogyna TaxID=1202772 RepID=A0A0A7CNS2_ACHHY|nr:secreted protein [Achlya hypogyna]OQR80647.1 glycoside hydrolase family 18 protein [Achlya hypogyna]